MPHIYKSKEWESLGEIDRAQLLLVIEGLKRGTIIGGNLTTLPKILGKTGLSYQLNSRRYSLFPAMKIAKPEDLQKLSRSYIMMGKNPNDLDYDTVLGEFLSYPKCCIAEYARPRTLEEKKEDLKGNRPLTYRYGREIVDLINREGKYPEVFDYRVPSFTPCSVHCKESIGLLSTWRDALKKYDPKAAHELALFNRRSLPERLVHMDYLSSEFKRRNLEHRLSCLRGSIEK